MGHFYITCVEGIQQYYVIWLEIVWERVGNELDLFGKFVGKVTLA